MAVGNSSMAGEVPGQIDELCRLEIPLHSPGIWSLNEARGFLHYTLPRLQLQLAIIFLLSQSVHALLKRYYLPRVISELLAGIILGPTILGWMSPNTMDTLFPEEGDVFIEGLSITGFMFFMFLIGVKMDPDKVFKAGIKPWIIGVGAVIIPVTVARMLSDPLDSLHPYRKPTAKSVTGILTLTPFPVIASLLIDLKIMNSELGRLALASTLISDMLSTLASVVIANTRVSWAAWSTMIAVKPYAMSVFVVSSILLMHPVFRWIIKQTPEGKGVKRAYITFISGLVLLSATAGDNVGLPYDLGPFLLGLCVPDGPPLGSSLVEKLETVMSGFFVPLLSVYCGMKLDLFVVYDMQFVGILWTLISGCVVVKFISILFPSLICQVPIRDAFALSLIMSAQGIVQIALYLSLFINQTVDREALSVLSVSVILMASITWVSVRYIYDYSRIYTGYQKRSILHNAHNAELRVLVCIHRQDEALASIKLLEVSNPTKESPIATYALNLMELAGRATPLLINHRLGQKASSGGSRSQKVMDVFHQFEQQYSDLVTLQMYTAMSLMKFMHHDICSLAFDKSVSFIILPFHRKWNHQGKTLFNNNAIRMVNQQALEMAPCSLGILIDRSKIRPQSALQTTATGLPNSPYNVAVVFLGGDDDREALAYGKRMAKSSGVHLTVVRLVAWDDAGVNQWDAVLDIEVLKEIRLQCSNQGNIVYREEKINDGPDTALIVNEMKEDFDLVLVGRRHRKESPLLSGLTEWNDLPELGPIGDILASEDIRRPVSVLVVQQQRVKSK